MNEQMRQLLAKAVDGEPRYGYTRVDQIPVSAQEVRTVIENDPDVLDTLFSGPQDERARWVRNILTALNERDHLDQHIALGAAFSLILKACVQRQLMHLVDVETLKDSEPKQGESERKAADAASVRQFGGL
jgi:hypothetical protein